MRRRGSVGGGRRRWVGEGGAALGLVERLRSTGQRGGREGVGKQEAQRAAAGACCGWPAGMDALRRAPAGLPTLPLLSSLPAHFTTTNFSPRLESINEWTNQQSGLALPLVLSLPTYFITTFLPALASLPSGRPCFRSSISKPAGGGQETRHNG